MHNVLYIIFKVRIFSTVGFTQSEIQIVLLLQIIGQSLLYLSHSLVYRVVILYARCIINPNNLQWITHTVENLAQVN
jgi:hypothetical protein